MKGFALASILGIAVLLGLGTWQLQRLTVKEQMLALRHAALTAAPVSPPRTLDDALALNFHPVRARGVFLHDRELYLIATNEAGAAGVQVMTPLTLEDGSVFFVERGFVPQARRDPRTRPQGQIEGVVEVTGLLRLPPVGKGSWFVPENDLRRNDWFRVDLPAMAAAAGVTGVLPYYLDADATPNPGGWPRGGQTPLDLPNNHLQYAITWYLLAVGLGAVSLVYIFRPHGARS
ncbi:MAG TPA: SURF1 family protein [Stellaceae bacterium]|nr:SURF1 family protein [Stellaceae bacterium]